MVNQYGRPGYWPNPIVNFQHDLKQFSVDKGMLLVQDGGRSTAMLPLSLVKSVNCSQDGDWYRVRVVYEPFSDAAVEYHDGVPSLEILCSQNEVSALSAVRTVQDHISYLSTQRKKRQV